MKIENNFEKFDKIIKMINYKNLENVKGSKFYFSNSQKLGILFPKENRIVVNNLMEREVKNIIKSLSFDKDKDFIIINIENGKEVTKKDFALYFPPRMTLGKYVIYFANNEGDIYRTFSKPLANLIFAINELNRITEMEILETPTYLGVKTMINLITKIHGVEVGEISEEIYSKIVFNIVGGYSKMETPKISRLLDLSIVSL